MSKNKTQEMREIPNIGRKEKKGVEGKTPTPPNQKSEQSVPWIELTTAKSAWVKKLKADLNAFYLTKGKV